MMSSVIPARLDFQCGHAALVSLPRVKGESSAERTRRIALEKSGAQARACDFCAPRLEVVADVVVTDVVAAADLQSTVAETTVARPAATLPTPPEVAPTPEPDDIVPAAIEVAPQADAAAHATPVEPAARPVRRQAHRSRSRSRSNGHSAATVAAASQLRFVVHFEAEAVLEAADIRHALRLAASLGATDVVAITRDA